MLYKNITNIQELQKLGDFSCGYPVYPWKKNIVFYSNCHGLPLSELLRHNPKIFNEYNVFLILAYLYDKKEEYNVTDIPLDIIYNLVSIADVFIFQPCYQNKPDISSDTLLSKLKENSKTIKISNPQNTALWALHFPEHQRTYYHIHEEYIKSMTILKLRDQESDTPVYQYIVENLKKHKLFIDRPHPTFRLFIQIAKYIWDILDAEHLVFTDEYIDNNPNPCCLPGEVPKIDIDYDLHLSI